MATGSPAGRRAQFLQVAACAPWMHALLDMADAGECGLQGLQRAGRRRAARLDDDPGPKPHAHAPHRHTGHLGPPRLTHPPALRLDLRSPCRYPTAIKNHSHLDNLVSTTHLTALGFAAAVTGLAAAPVQIVVAADYLSVEGAQRQMFPQADRFSEVVFALSPAQRQQVATLAGEQPPHRSLRAFRALHAQETLGYVFIDEVVGKEDFITYAASIDAQGRLGTPEVMSYRESHGGEIRNEAWRRQFAGRASLEHLHIQTDIKNIAGATLSCSHVTQGVRWLMALWQVALKPPAVA